MDELAVRRNPARRDVAHRQDVPIVLTGFVERNDAPSFCRDGADFLLETVGWHRRVRLAAEMPRAVRALDRAVENSEAVVVRGSLRRGDAPGCDLLVVHGICSVERFVSAESHATGPAVWGTDAGSGEHASVG